jgi:hypothetical protein
MAKEWPNESLKADGLTEELISTIEAVLKGHLSYEDAASWAVRQMHDRDPRSRQVIEAAGLRQLAVSPHLKREDAEAGFKEVLASLRGETDYKLSIQRYSEADLRRRLPAASFASKVRAG